MKLLDAKVGMSYTVKDIQLCEPCDIKNKDSCMILSLMERGMVPGSSLQVKSKKLGMYELLIDGSHFVVRQPEMEKYNIEIE